MANVIVSTRYGSLIVNTLDQHLGSAILRNGYWCEDDIRLISQILRQRLGTSNHVTFYDVGANIGTHTIAIAQMAPTRVRVRSFEAQRAIYHMLCGNVALNNLYNVVCHHSAVTEPGVKSIKVDLPNYLVANNFAGLELRPPKYSDNQNMVRGHADIVPALSLDVFGEQVDFIKLDVEGMEDAVLRGASALFKRCRPAVLAETFKTDENFVCGFFKERGYTAARKGPDVLFQPSESALVDARGYEKLF
jgi:FkbM family methyltransferase